MTTPETGNPDKIIERIEVLIDELGQTAPDLRARAQEVVRLLMQLHGSGFARVLEIVGEEDVTKLAGDQLVASLLLLHGLHPVDAGTRVRDALRNVEGRLDGHRLQLTGISNGMANVRVTLNAGQLPHDLTGTIERAIAECAPDIAGVEVNGLPRKAPILVQIEPAPRGSN